jgi:hypothetical protein
VEKYTHTMHWDGGEAEYFYNPSTRTVYELSGKYCVDRFDLIGKWKAIEIAPISLENE